jgi:chemotaxis protein histidine kinase CheA
MVSSITQTKAEVQKLIKLYNQLQQEAKTAPTEEAARKVAQAEKLVSQINTLQAALSKTKAIDPATAAKKTTARTAKTATTTSATSTNKGIKHTDLAEVKRFELEQRIGRIEEAQKNTRVKIEQLNVAKAELERLQIEAEKNAVQLEQRAKEKRQPQAQELANLNERIQSREAQYQSLKKELDTVRQQSQKDAELLKDQRDAAVEKQKQLEKEKMTLLRYGGSSKGFLNGLLIGVGVGVLCIAALAVVIFKTPWLDEAVCHLKDYPTECSFSQTTNNDTTKQSTKPEKPPVERQQ